MIKKFILTLSFLFISSCYSGHSHKPLVYNGCWVETEFTDAGGESDYDIFFWVKFSF